jgi:hypothetical protein
MKHQLKRVAPLRAGIVLAALYVFLGLIELPVFLILAANKGGPTVAFGGVLFLCLIVPMAAAFGFIGGVVGAAIYNVIAKWTGGFEFEFQDPPPLAVA